MSMTWHELGLTIAQLDAPDITLDGIIAEKLKRNPRTRFTASFEAARSVLPEGWGYILDASPRRDPYCDAIGNQRVGSTGRTDERALLAAACMAQAYLEGVERRRQAEIAARAAREKAQAPADAQQPAATAVQFHEAGDEDGPITGTLTILEPPP